MEKFKKIQLLISMMFIVLACIGCASNGNGKCEECGEQKEVYKYECAPYPYMSGSGELEYETKYFCGDCATKLYNRNMYADIREKTNFEAFSIVLTLIICVIGVAAAGTYWGNKVNEVVANKGYNEDWFWTGFWGKQMALNEALALPQKSLTNKNESKLLSTAKKDESSLKDAWKCDKCGMINPNYTGTCSCGNSKNRRGNDNVAETTKKENKDELKEELNNIELIKKYKELLDSGAITQEEFDKKKNEILN